MSDPEEVVEARRMTEEGLTLCKEGDFDGACKLLTKALSVFMRYIDEDGKFIYPKETARLLCSLPYGCILRASGSKFVK
ncbi:MAG: tetratricopeptide repeat protein [Promethearchaeota archaeon]